MSDLKPCPFCGSDIEFIPSHVEEQNFVNSASIICRKCRKEYVGATFIVPGEIESEELTNNILINWWNTRPAEDAKDKDIDNLKAEVTRYRRALHNLKEDCQKRLRWKNRSWEGLFLHEVITHIDAELDFAPDTGKMEEN